MNRGVNTDNGACHACDPVVAVGLNDTSRRYTLGPPQLLR
jgi:hypothetical protein